MSARFRFLIINCPNLSCQGMGSYITTATNKDEDDDDDNDKDAGVPDARAFRIRSRARIVGRVRQGGNPTTSSMMMTTTMRKRPSLCGDDPPSLSLSSIHRHTSGLRRRCYPPPSPRSNYDRKQRFTITLAVFVAAFVGAPLLIIGPAPEGSLAVVPSSPLVIIIIAIVADALFDNRDEAAPMGGDGGRQGYHLDVVAATGGGGGRRRRAAKAVAGGEAG